LLLCPVWDSNRALLKVLFMEHNSESHTQITLHTTNYIEVALECLGMRLVNRVWARDALRDTHQHVAYSRPLGDWLRIRLKKPHPCG
jgi:hypothetical protein